MPTELFPRIEPGVTGLLELDGLHVMYWEVSVNSDGVPVVFLHGGPGAGAAPITAASSIRPITASSFSISAAPDGRARWASSRTTPRLI